MREVISWLSHDDNWIAVLSLALVAVVMVVCDWYFRHNPAEFD